MKRLVDLLIRRLEILNSIPTTVIVVVIIVIVILLPPLSIHLILTHEKLQRSHHNLRTRMKRGSSNPIRRLGISPHLPPPHVRKHSQSPLRTHFILLLHDRQQYILNLSIKLLIPPLFIRTLDISSNVP